MTGKPNPAPERSLIESLTDTVDIMRQLQTDFGMRPYRVFAVVVEHSTEVGRGEPKVVVDRELLPTPLVRLRGVRVERTTAGKTERGYTEICEISPRYTEAELQASFHVKPLTEAHEAFYEIQFDRREGADPTRRRFALVAPPEFNPGSSESAPGDGGPQWILRVQSQNQNRGARGAPNSKGRTWQP